MVCGCCGRFVGFGRSRGQHKKGPRQIAGARCITESEGSVLRCFRGFLGSLRIGSGRFRLGFAAVEPAYGVSPNGPRGDLRGLRFLAFTVRALVSRADQAAFDKDVRPLLNCLCDIFRESRPEDADAMPLGLRGPLVLRALPVSLRGRPKTREVCAVIARLTLLGVRSDKSDDCY